MLQEFLDKKPLFYDEIDYSRMPRVYEKIKTHFDLPKIVHLVGTNGKGTTGRFLATALYSLGYKVGHYTSPHILKFNERIWLNGKNASDGMLESAHAELQSILDSLDSDALSYFEYTTFLAMLLFRGCDFVVMEAGLGGEHDATAVFPKSLMLVTPIDYDHEAFLGTNIQEIATTKLNAMQSDVILANQKYEAVNSIAQEKAGQKGLKAFKVEELLEDADRKKIQEISKSLSLAPYLQKNLSLSVAALKYLRLDYSTENFNDSMLFGRLTKLCENVLIDVGHNPLAAVSIRESLFPQKYVLVYNTYKDKNYREILSILEPIILHVEIIDIFGQRVEETQKLKNTLTDLKIQYTSFKQIDKNRNYLVFGSFSVVEEFLKKGLCE